MGSDRHAPITGAHDTKPAVTSTNQAQELQKLDRAASYEIWVSALDAVKSITINAGHQYFEQDRKGSIEVGKLADLVILSANPLTISPEKIKDIMVTETIKQGTTVYPATSYEAPGHGRRAPAGYLWHGRC